MRLPINWLGNLAHAGLASPGAMAAAMSAAVVPRNVTRRAIGKGDADHFGH